MNLFVTDNHQQNVLFHRELEIWKHDSETNLVFVIPLKETQDSFYFIKLISDEFLQCEFQLPLSFLNYSPVEKFPLPSEF